MDVFIASCKTRGHRTIYGESGAELLAIVQEEQDGPGGPGKHNINCVMKFELLQGDPVRLKYVPEQVTKAHLVDVDPMNERPGED